MYKRFAHPLSYYHHNIYYQRFLPILRSTYKDLRTSVDFSDVTLVCEDGQVGQRLMNKMNLSQTMWTENSMNYFQDVLLVIPVYWVLSDWPNWSEMLRLITGAELNHLPLPTGPSWTLSCMVGFWHWHIPNFIITDTFPPWWDFVMVGICRQAAMMMMMLASVQGSLRGR